MNWAELIPQYGFQTAACIAMGWYVWINNNQNREDRKETETENREQISELSRLYNEKTQELTEVINNNTIVLEKILTKMGEDEE